MANACLCAFPEGMHRIEIPHYTSEINRWLEDPSRPGHFYWSILAMDHSDDRHAYALYVSDPDVAFEAKIRWG